MRIEWSPPVAADKVRNRIVSALDRLARHPFVGRAGRITNTREFVFTDIPYIGIYEVDTDAQHVTSMNIVHTARLYPSETEE